MRRGTYILVGMSAMLAGFSCGLHAQVENNTNSSGCCKSNKPCVHITVHKQLDRDGNIESYDSVYTYTFDGSLADTGFMNSVMKHGGMSIQIFTSPNGMPDFMNDPFFQHFDMSLDMDQMQKMMQKQMQDLMQNAGMNDLQFFVPPTPPPCAPKPEEKKHCCPSKKCAPKHNVAKGGVQI